MRHTLVLNFKTYKEATGKKALRLLKVCDRIGSKGKAEILAAVQPADLHYAKEVSTKVISQHVDEFKQGRNTGFVTLESAKSKGAYGTLLNHSEHKLRLKIISETVKRCKKAGFKTVVCAASVNEAKKILLLGPDYLAFEDPELIATGKSITKVKPDRVKAFVKLFGAGTKTIPLCGAGVSNSEDFKAALSLGCKGVLLSSAFVKAKNPEKALKNMLKI